MSSDDRPDAGERPEVPTEQSPAPARSGVLSDHAEPQGAEPDLDAPPPLRRSLRRVLISLAVLGLVLAVTVGGGVWFLTNRYGGNISRVSNVFSKLDEGARPAPATPVQPAKAD